MKKDIHHIHDKTYRSFFENKEIFLQLLQSFVQEQWTTQLEPSQLIEDKSHYILRDFEEAEADIVYTATIEGQEVIFCILLELQSTVDHSMAIRLFYYITEIWRKYLKRFKSDVVKKKDFKLPAIIPIVLYNGEKTWTATTQFKDKVQRADLFGNHVIDFNYLLINVHDYTKETLLGIQNTVSAIFLLDQKIDAVEFINRAALIATEFDSLSKEHKLKLKDWLDHVIKDPVRQIVLDLLNANKEEVSTMTANITRTLQEDQEKAEARGEVRGEARGEEKAKLEVAKKMLARGISLEDVMDMTDLPKETLLNLH